MLERKSWFILFAVLAIAFISSAQDAAAASPQLTLFQEEATTSQTAVFAAFLSSISGGSQGDTAFSVSNVLAVPPGETFAALRIDGKNDRTGGLRFYLYTRAGDTYVFSTEDNPVVGSGADENGRLSPGQTYTVLLSEILAALQMGTESFSGYGWIVADFDAVGGTYTNFFPQISGSQSFELWPQGDGIPVEVP